MFRPTPTFAAQATNLVHAPTTVAHAENRSPEGRFCRPGARDIAAVMPWDYASFAGRGIATSMASLMPTIQSGIPADVAIEDWDVLMSAVKERLRVNVSERLALIHEGAPNDVADQVRTSVLECSDAIDQLRATQEHELSRRQQLELEVFDARSALAQARVELAKTRVQQRRAHHLARHDSLTSLPNRSYFGERLTQALVQLAPKRRPLAVLYLDLDGFKPVNDSFGHATGDELLRIVAARLTQTLRAEDLVGRLGGDEFACLLGDLPNQQPLSHLARKLFDAVSAPVKIGPLKLMVRPSIGIAVCPAGGATADSLLKCADAAMYRAKREQTGYAFFDACTDVRAHDAEAPPFHS